MASVSVKSTIFEGFGSVNVQASSSEHNGTATTSVNAFGNAGELNANASASGSNGSSSSSSLQLTSDKSDTTTETSSIASTHAEGGATATAGATDGEHLIVDSSARAANGVSSSATSSASAHGVFDAHGNFISGAISTDTRAEGNATATATASNGNTSASETTISEIGELISNGSEKDFVYHVEMGNFKYNYGQFETTSGTDWYLIGENSSTNETYMLSGPGDTALYQQLKDEAQAWSSHSSDGNFVPEGAEVKHLSVSSSDADFHFV